MKFAYVEFYDLVYASAWDDEIIELNDTLHVGIGILLEDKPDYIMICMAMGNNKDQPFSRLLIPRKMVIRLIEIDHTAFTDRLLINGYGTFPDDKISDSDNKSE